MPARKTIIKKNVVDRNKHKGKLLFIDKKGNLTSVPMKKRK